PDAYRIASRNLRDIGRIVRRIERRPQLLDDAAALLLEHALKAADLLVAEGEIVGDGGGGLELHLFADVIGERVERLRRRIRGAGEIWIAAALRDVFGASESECWHLGLRQIIERREQFECRERPEHDIDLV